MSEYLQFSSQGEIAIICLNRPKANAIDTAVSQALYQALQQFNEDPQYRVAILTAAGEKFFSAGWDLKAAAAGEETATDSYSPGGFAGITEFFSLSKPVIAAVNGMAVGGGFEMALACDMIVAAEHAQFFLPEANIGLVPDAGGILRLPKRIPQNIAVEMMYTGRRMGAAEAHHWGLVNKVVASADLMAEALILAQSICNSAPLSVLTIKDIVKQTAHLSVEQGYDLLNSGTVSSYERFKRSEDIEEGAKAFAEGRAPVWKGQ